MTTSRFLSPILVLLGMLGGCAADSPTRLHHVVLCWLREPGNLEHRARLMETGAGLHVIPEVRRLESGPAVATNHPAVDHSFDVGFVMTFDDLAALERYQDHPLHRRAVTDVLQPLCARVVIYDIQAEPATAPP